MKLVTTFNVFRNLEFNETSLKSIDAIFSLFLVIFLNQIGSSINIAMFYFNNGNFNFKPESATTQVVGISFLIFEIVVFALIAQKERANILVRYLFLYPSTKIYSFLIFQISFLIFVGIYSVWKIDLSKFYPDFIAAVFSSIVYLLLILRKIRNFPVWAH